MKKNVLLMLAIVSGGFLLIQARVTDNEIASSSKVDTTVVAYSGKVKAIIDNKCYGCHNPQSRSEKAKGKLDWTLLPSLSKIDQISRLGKIEEVMDKGDMPPKKYLEHKPQAKLTAEEAEALKTWAKKTSDFLLK